MTLNNNQVDELFVVIKQSIQAGLSEKVLQEKISNDAALNQSAACFVTLHIAGQLRGCIGSLQAHRALIDDINHNAYAAAFRDPRFAPLKQEEASRLDIEFSVLTAPVAIPNCETKQALLEQLQPNMDGLIISDGARRATFLPSVWAQLPDKTEFVNHLMRKAGISDWSSQMQCQRYHVKAFEKSWQEIEV